MRESIGATWIFSICMTFIVLFTAYLAISVNYTKAFRLKSHIVNVIEENGTYSEEEIRTYLVAQGYSARGMCNAISDKNGGSTDWVLNDCIDGRSDGTCAACIYRMDITTQNDDIDAGKSYYKVVAFFKFDLPIVNIILEPFKVSGDTKCIYES